MIQINAENSLSIHLINTSKSNNNDIKTFTEVIKICKAESEKAGFRNIFNKKHRELIENIHDQIISEK